MVPQIKKHQQKNTPYLASFLIFLLLLFLSHRLVSAQATPNEIVINYHQEQEGAESIFITTYFTILNTDGTVATDAKVSTATFTMADDSTYPASYISGNLDSPLYIVMALDLSGSMQNSVTQMRDAAIQALEDMPATANIAFVAFNDTVSIPTRFLSRGEARDWLLGITLDQATGGTKLYDGAYEAIRTAREGAENDPTARRAVILFTDGRDEQIQGQGIQYSANSVEEMIQFAQQETAPVPIYTIGLGDATSELQDISGRTGGIGLRAGDETDLNNDFREIMTAIQSQWLVNGLIYPTDPGEQGVRLEILYGNAGQGLDKRFNINALRAFEPPDATELRVSLGSFVADPDNRRYRLELISTRPEETGTIEVRIQRDGLDVRTDRFQDYTDVTVDMGDLEPGPYVMLVTGSDVEGNPILDEDDEGVLGIREFEHQPDVVETSIVIDSITQEGTSPIAIIRVETTAVDAVREYEVKVTDTNTGQTAETITADFSLSSVVEITTGYGEFQIDIEGFDRNGKSIAFSEPSEVSIIEPVRPGFFGRIFNFFGSNPPLCWSILAVVGGVVAFFMFDANREKKRSTGTPVIKSILEKRNQEAETSNPRERALNHTHLHGELKNNRGQTTEQVNSTVMGIGDAARLNMPTIQIELSLIDEASTLVDAVEVARPILITNEDLPLMIGRETKSSKLKRLLSRDKTISREHAKLNFSNGWFHITDLNSTNGVRVNDKQLRPQEPEQLKKDQVYTIQLSKHTKLRFRGRLG